MFVLLRIGKIAVALQQNTGVDLAKQELLTS
jgi:hypothetical protein